MLNLKNPIRSLGLIRNIEVEHLEAWKFTAEAYEKVLKVSSPKYLHKKPTYG